MKYGSTSMKKVKYIEGLKELIEDIIIEGNKDKIKPEYLEWYNEYYL